VRKIKKRALGVPRWVEYRENSVWILENTRGGILRLEGSANLPDPDVLTLEIAEELF
jgi:hypothetical protein